MSSQNIAQPRDGQISQVEYKRASKILANFTAGLSHDDYSMRNIAVASTARAFLAKEEISQQTYQRILSSGQFSEFPPHSRPLDPQTIQNAAEHVEGQRQKGLSYQEIARNGIAYAEERYPTNESPWKRSLSTGAQAAERYYGEERQTYNSDQNFNSGIYGGGGYPASTPNYPPSVPPPPSHFQSHEYGYGPKPKMPSGKEILKDALGDGAFDKVGSYYQAPQVYDYWYRTAVSCKAEELMAKRYQQTGNSRYMPLRGSPSSSALEAAAYEVRQGEGIESLRNTAIRSIDQTNKIMGDANPHAWREVLTAGDRSLSQYRYQPGEKDQKQHDREREKYFKDNERHYHYEAPRSDYRYDYNNSFPRQLPLPPGVGAGLDFLNRLGRIRK